jgi:hypothetical protein
MKCLSTGVLSVGTPPFAAYSSPQVHQMGAATPAPARDRGYLVKLRRNLASYSNVTFPIRSFAIPQSSSAIDEPIANLNACPAGPEPNFFLYGLAHGGRNGVCNKAWDRPQ